MKNFLFFLYRLENIDNGTQTATFSYTAEGVTVNDSKSVSVEQDESGYTGQIVIEAKSISPQESSSVTIEANQISKHFYNVYGTTYNAMTVEFSTYSGGGSGANIN